MKKLAIVTRKMEMGGVQKALISMLQALPKNKYNITLFIMSEGGELDADIPDWIKVKRIPSYHWKAKQILLHFMKSGQGFQASRALYHLSLLRMNKEYYRQYYDKARSLPKVDETFDLAFAYDMPCGFCDWFTINNIKAAKKYVWIHSDLSKFRNIGVPVCHKLYQKYDKVICISEDVKKRFSERFPDLEAKAEVVYNIISKENIVLNGDKDGGFDDTFDGIRILTVGRLSKEKGQYIIPSVLSSLKDRGYSVRWYCIGDGSLRGALEREIKAKGLTNDLILLGSKMNPYPYFKQCDIYVQPSRVEGYCISLCEARCFNKPIIATNIVGAGEQISDGYTGFVVNFEAEEMSGKIETLMTNPAMMQQFSNNLKRQPVDTFDQLAKLEQLSG